MDSPLVTLIVAILYSIATWRLARLLVKEEGPFDFMARARDWIGVYYDEKTRCVGRNVFAKGLCCIKCTSLWVAIPFAIVSQPGNVAQFGAFILVYSGATLLIDRWYEG